MSMIESILYKKMNPGDLWNIDRPPGTVEGGGGQTYINLKIDQAVLTRFLQYGTRSYKPTDHLSRDVIKISAISLGNPADVELITFDPRPGRNDYRITNQHTLRHPAWTSRTGFPTVPVSCKSAEDVDTLGLVNNLVIFIVRTDEQRYYAGFINQSTMPASWATGVGLQILLSGQTDVIDFVPKIPLSSII
ncbi:hypothetical protein [Mesobacillus foraminis]|uniref:Uncharacterized protein n=1 Tax=Mesobacillus foraminis TaxID=279826 RepID=A0A4V2RBZ9_9BACI|nr:hypothetical protein [Mesobacillus foraminis]TCN18950.1 hypothetical protein EV146_11837 [Mesobacillus foraminis]